MNFTAKDVQSLRERTGCGMMDCKKALTEADGDMEKAIAVSYTHLSVVKRSSAVTAGGRL